MKRIVLAASILGLLSAAAALLAAAYLSAPARAVIGAPPPGLAIQALRISSASGSELAAWFLPGSGRGGVVLMHGVRANRLSMVGRMQMLHEAGYATLAFDFQAHGESDGDRITFGSLESLDAEAAVAWMRQRLPAERIGVIGVSLGGAAALLAERRLPVDALVLESVYPDIDRAVADRLSLYLGGLGALTAQAFVTAGELVTGVSAGDLRPIDRIGGLDFPVLVIAGTEDRRTPLDESREMLARAPEGTWMWEVEGADHVDLAAFAGQEYERRVLAFLAHSLRRSTE